MKCTNSTTARHQNIKPIEKKHRNLFYCLYLVLSQMGDCFCRKVQVGKDQEKAQSEKDSHSKNRGGKKPN